MSAQVAVFAVGNRSRGDDGVAPLLLDRLGPWLEAHGLTTQFELIEEYQLQVENALDLDGRRLALFIDASLDAPVGVALGEVRARAGLANSHALEPPAVLDVCRRLTGETPAAFALEVKARSFELGEGLSQETAAALEKAWELLCALAGNPQRTAWQALADCHDSGTKICFDAGSRQQGGGSHGDQESCAKEGPCQEGPC